VEERRGTVDDRHPGHESRSVLSSPRVSVITNCYNGEKYLRAAIDSVYAQTYRDWELVLWDNGSTDATPEIARTDDERLRYFRNDGATVPLGEARNRAIAMCRGEYIAFLDCDDLWLPERLARGVATLDAQTGCDFVYSNFFHFDDSGRETLALRGEQPAGHVFEQFLQRYPVGILTVLLRKRALERLDELFDPSLHISEEYDLFMRLLYGAKAAYIAEPLAKYRIHPGMSTVTRADCATAEFYHSLAKLRALDAREGGRYRRAFDRANAVVEYARAKQHLAAGDLRQARRYIAPFKWSSPKAAAVFLATFLPVPVWFALKPFWARGTFR
jgi:glycosyltransferase involved in cell wall biosynthesis